MTVDRIIQAGKEVIRIEAEAVANLINSIDNQFAKAVDVIYNSKGRVVFSGMGKSGLIARKIVATLNSTGTAAIFLHPTDALHGDLGMVRKDDVVILISKSGESSEIVNLLPMFKRLKVALIAMTANPKSSLAKKCDILLNIDVKEEACPHDLAPTASTTVTLVLGDALSVALLQKNGFTVEDFAFLHPGGSLGKRLSLKISEIMIKGDNIPTVDKEAPIKDAILEITSKRLGATCVINKNGILKGIITDGDLRRLLEKSLSINGLKAKDIMTSDPKILEQDYLASFALQQMENHKITTLVITDTEKKPIGMIHLHDLINLGLRQR